MLPSDIVQNSVLAIDAVLALIKSVRAGKATVASLSDALKGLNETQMIIVADISRMKLDLLKSVRDLQSLFSS